jgi:hypothetical protein
MSHIHDYKVLVDNAEVKKERCKICRKIVTFTKERWTGRIDNNRYLKEHIRNFAQPWGRTGNQYRRIYGNPDPRKFAYKKPEQAKKENERGWDELDRRTKNRVLEQTHV